MVRLRVIIILIELVWVITFVRLVVVMFGVVRVAGVKWVRVGLIRW